MSFYRSLLQNRQIIIGGGIVAVLTTVAIFAPYISTHSYWSQDYMAALQPPSTAHFMGTDNYGRDIFSRVVYGARTSLLTAAGIAAVAGFVGVFLGTLGGYFGGWTDRFIQGLIDIAWTFPTLLLAIALVVILQPGQMSIIIAISAGWWAQYARVMRGEVYKTREEDYVEAARAAGAGNVHILRRVILPNAVPSVIVLITTTMGRAIILEAMLSFLGIGVQPPTPSWGAILSNARDFISNAYWYITYPGIVLSVTVLGFNLLGDGLRDVLDPYLKNQ